MTDFEDRLSDPLARYAHHGDVRPSSRRLVETAVYLQATAASPASRLVLADVFIDMAMSDGETSGTQNIDSARDTLESIVDDVKLMEQTGFNSEHVRYAGYAASAAMRLGELESWRTAAEGSSVELDYEELLRFSWQAARLSGINAGSAPRLMEVVPVLLGARTEELHRTGWLSRLSLVREDQRFYQIHDHNANWDVGIAADDSPEAYDRPDTKLQIKSSHKKHQGRYRRSGIRTLSAEKLGFREAHRVIRSCLKEADPSSIHRSRNKKRFLTSGELDEITDRIAREAGLEVESGPEVMVGEEGIEPSIR